MGNLNALFYLAAFSQYCLITDLKRNRILYFSHSPLPFFVNCLCCTLLHSWKLLHTDLLPLLIIFLTVHASLRTFWFHLNNYMRTESLLGACLRHCISTQDCLSPSFTAVCILTAEQSTHSLSQIPPISHYSVQKPRGYLLSLTLSIVYELFFHISFHFTLLLLLSNALIKPSRSSLDDKSYCCFK